MARRIELVCGVLGGLVGLAALGTALVTPLGMTCYGAPQGTPTPGCHPTSLVQTQSLSSLAFVIAVFGGLSLGVLLFAVWHGLSRSVPALVLLWVCTVLLLGATVLGVLSIGLLFLPADVLALVASGTGTGAVGQRTPVQR